MSLCGSVFQCISLSLSLSELGGISHPVTLKPTPYVPPGATASSFVATQLLSTPPTPHKATIKKSPKKNKSPKRNANVMPINGPAPPQREWLEFGSGGHEEFIELHTEFGKEVKELMVDWLRCSRGGQQEAVGNLIDLG